MYTEELLNAKSNEEKAYRVNRLIRWLDWVNREFGESKWSEKEWLQFIDRYYRKMETNPESPLTFRTLDLILKRYIESEKIKELKDQVYLPF